MAEKEWYSAGEAADYLGVNLNRLGRLRREGRIKGVSNGGKNTRYTMYHISQLENVDTSDQRKKVSESGHKPDEDDKQGGRTSNVMFKRSEKAAYLVGAAS